MDNPLEILARKVLDGVRQDIAAELVKADIEGRKMALRVQMELLAKLRPSTQVAFDAWTKAMSEVGE